MCVSFLFVPWWTVFAGEYVGYPAMEEQWKWKDVLSMMFPMPELVMVARVFRSSGTADRLLALSCRTRPRALVWVPLLARMVRPMTRLPTLPPEHLPPMKPLLWKNGERQPLGLEQLGN